MSTVDPIIGKQSYLPNVDGLRAISIALVLIEHFLWSGHGIAAAGVLMFFVISGFLITSILMSYADKLTIRDAAITFYSRRTLRLFPIYYLCIAVTAALNIGGMRHTWLVNALYLNNVKIALDGAWNKSSHFWSLAIEEQFYLLWFFAVMKTSRARLSPIIFGCILIAPIYRWAMYALGSPFMNLLLPGVMDSLATGALLACVVRHLQEETRTIFTTLCRPLASTSLCLTLGVLVAGGGFLTTVILPCLINVLAFCLLVLAIDDKKDWRIDWLGGKWIRHIGKISYGIYVYHYFVPEFIDSHLKFAWAHRYHMTRAVRFAILVAISVGLAETSWELIENPLLKLKDRISLFSPQAKFTSPKARVVE